MPGSFSDQKIWEKEQEFLARERQAHPELFYIDPEKKGNVLEKVGIKAVAKDLPAGYIRLSPLDFLVEEIDSQGHAIEISAGPATAETAADAGQGTIYAELVKIGVSTLDAAERVTAGLKLPAEKLRYAGIKDALAITAQRISIRGAALDAVRALDEPNVILKNCHEGKGALNVGDLQGNRFTLFIRTREDFDGRTFNERYARLEADGVSNYYGTQRFGSPRFLSHFFGMFLHRGDLPGLCRAFLTQPSPTELPYTADLRARAGEHYGDWSAMRGFMETLPYTFRFELMMLRALAEAGSATDAWMRAVAAVPAAQTNLWARAYASYLVNSLLSDAAAAGRELPASIPILSWERDSQRLYAPYLQADGTAAFADELRKLPFIVSARSPRLETKIRPKLRGAKIVPEGVAVSFELLKGAYATTVLMNLFNVLTGKPVPTWVKDKEYDTKALLGLGTIAEVTERFQPIIAKMSALRKAAGEVGDET
jgi:TruD family tRNA pseudouridine synthase